MIHVFDIVKGNHKVSAFSAGQRVTFRSYGSEINAWKLTYSLNPSDVGVSNIWQIDRSFIKGMGY